MLNHVKPSIGIFFSGNHIQLGESPSANKIQNDTWETNGTLLLLRMRNGTGNDNIEWPNSLANCLAYAYLQCLLTIQWAAFLSTCECEKSQEIDMQTMQTYIYAII